MSREATRPTWDCVIVGAGPAGLNAALVLGRARWRVLVLDDGAPRNYATHEMHGVLGHDGLDPAELPYASDEQRYRQSPTAGRRLPGPSSRHCTRRYGKCWLRLPDRRQVRARADCWFPCRATGPTRTRTRRRQPPAERPHSAERCARAWG